MRAIEEKRQQLQKELDSGKDLKARNKLGQFSTPYNLAFEICLYLKEYIHETIDDFLEPSVGTGVFYSVLSELFNVKYTEAYEIDEYYFNPTKNLWKDYNIKLYNKDFLREVVSKKFSLIIANPPYSRHHHLPTEYKNELLCKIRSIYGIEVSGLAGLYVYFIILSTLWLKDGGYSCWLVPSEFLSVNYGIALKRFLLSKVDLISIHSFDSENVQFDDALVSSSIIVFRNTLPQSRNIKFTWGKDLNTPDYTKYIDRLDLDPVNKWNKSFICNSFEAKYQQIKTIGSFFQIKRGIATGDNGFFVINRATVDKYYIPQKFLTPLIPPPRKLRSINYTIDLAYEDGLFLLSCQDSMEYLKDNFHGLYTYLQYGIDKGTNLKANCKNRSLWYKCETRATAPILATYMGRENGELPIKFILNKAQVTATNSYLMLYPKKEFQYLFQNNFITHKVWSILSQIPRDVLMAYGRSYGGGLFKWEPKELEAVPCPELEQILRLSHPPLF